MKAGRELDALIAEKVMGIETEYRKPCPSDERDWLMVKGGGRYEFVPSYSTDIKCAWLVVEKLRRQGIFLSVIPQIDNYAVYVWSNVGESDKYNTYPLGTLEAETAPLAICLAALKACGVEVEG
jgi:hypothetical protein